MKAQNPSTNAQNMRTEVRSDEPEGTGENGPSLAEIRQRAFEIHIERGVIHGCDLRRLDAGGTGAPHEVQARH
jgi:hypothetical protein